MSSGAGRARPPVAVGLIRAEDTGAARIEPPAGAASRRQGICRTGSTPGTPGPRRRRSRTRRRAAAADRRRKIGRQHGQRGDRRQDVVEVRDAMGDDRERVVRQVVRGQPDRRVSGEPMPLTDRQPHAEDHNERGGPDQDGAQRTLELDRRVRRHRRAVREDADVDTEIVEASPSEKPVPRTARDPDGDGPPVRAIP